MKILVACEFSGRVREAFRKLGHDAWSCDLLPSDDNSPYHIQGDVLERLNEGWDMMIAHPPCTYLSNAGLHYITGDSGRGIKVAEAVHFFLQLYNAKVPLIAVENPVGYMSTHFRKPDQIVQPFWFGEAERKATCLWLKGLPKLVPTDMVGIKPKGTVTRKTGPKAGKKYNYYFHNGKNAHERSRTFQSIANAMAEQWGKL